jgi:hypothetical protein
MPTVFGAHGGIDADHVASVHSQVQGQFTTPTRIVFDALEPVHILIVVANVLHWVGLLPTVLLRGGSATRIR